MQFEEFDNKAKEAAEHHHPAYDEQAWAKMEKLLNKHLPQKEDNRRRFLFFLLLFSGLAGAGLIIAKPWSVNKKMVTTEQAVQHKQTVNLPSTTETDKKAVSTDNRVEVKKGNIKNSISNDNKKLPPDFLATNEPSVLAISKPEKQNIKKQISITKSPDEKERNNQQITTVRKEKQEKDNETKNNKTDDNKATSPIVIEVNSSSANDVIATDKKETETVIVDKPANANGSPVSNESEKVTASKIESEPVAKNDILKKPKNKSRKSNSFFFTLSTGPDVSFVRSDKLGTTKLLVGAGLGYTFNNRFILRTGFYSARKVYTASPDAYNPPANFYIYYPYLEKVDADCKVYEIPISLSYNFSKSAKQSFFATAGISSYLMKEEKYNYFYKYTPSGPSYSHERTLKDENKHLFSAITIAGGYQRNIGKRISFIVEPYLKLPLSGVGYGKVKLNSGGVLFSIGIKPFEAKKEKPAIKQ